MANKILEELALATGLPEKLIQEELLGLIEAAGINEEDIDLEVLREILASYAQDVLISAKESYHKKASNS